MNVQYRTLSEVLKAGVTQLQPGLIVELPGARVGRVVQMTGGWQLRSHENISVLWTDAIADPQVFLAEVRKKFTKTCSPAQKQGILTSAILNGTHNDSYEDMKMAQKDIDDVAAKIKAAKQPGAYNGPGIAPNRGVDPTSLHPKSKATAPKAAAPKATAPKAAAPKATAPKAAAPKATAPKAAAPKATAPKAAAPKATAPKEKKERAPQAPRHSAAAMFKKLILDGKLKDDQIFATVAAEFGLDEKKRSYVAWYRADLKKRGLL